MTRNRDLMAVIAAIYALSWLALAEAMGWVDLNIWNLGEW